MSVIVRGIDMPKSCKECDLLQDYDGDMYCPLNNYLDFGDIENVPDYVMNGCPLVELPEKHGRLIDGDGLAVTLETAMITMKTMAQAFGAENDPEIKMEIKAYYDIWNGVMDMPTVIEAEGSE